jgi:hypothetical protein
LFVASDGAPELPGEIWQKGEDVAGEQVAPDLPEPEFDLIWPRDIGRSEVRQLLVVGREKGPHRTALVCGHFSDHDVDFATAGSACHESFQEGDEALARVAKDGVADDRARTGIERRVHSTLLREKEAAS